MRGERGQASVELLGALPALLVVALTVFQLLAIGYARVLAGEAAEAGALALAGGADARAAARNAIPGWSRAGMHVQSDAAAVRVSLRAPSPLRALARRIRVGAEARLAAPTERLARVAARTARRTRLARPPAPIPGPARPARLAAPTAERARPARLAAPVALRVRPPRRADEREAPR